LSPNILLNTLFSKTLSLCSSLKVKDQVSHPYSTTGRITVLYILIFNNYLSLKQREGHRFPYFSCSFSQFCEGNKFFFLSSRSACFRNSDVGFTRMKCDISFTRMPQALFWSHLRQVVSHVEMTTPPHSCASR
jgi:hypothetical protein